MFSKSLFTISLIAALYPVWSWTESVLPLNRFVKTRKVSTAKNFAPALVSSIQTEPTSWGFFSDTGGDGLIWGVPDQDHQRRSSAHVSKTALNTHQQRSNEDCALDLDYSYFDGMGGEAQCWHV
jgi:hypothetical protein